MLNQSSTFGTESCADSLWPTSPTLVSGVTRRESGEFVVCGGDPVADAASVERDIAVVRQSLPMDSMLPAIDNIKITVAFRGLRWRDARPRAEALMAQFGLEDVAGRLSFTLSGDERRRLQLVRALLVVLRLLILDEPWPATTRRVGGRCGS